MMGNFGVWVEKLEEDYESDEDFQPIKNKNRNKKKGLYMHDDSISIDFTKNVDLTESNFEHRTKSEMH